MLSGVAQPLSITSFRPAHPRAEPYGTRAHDEGHRSASRRWDVRPRSLARWNIPAHPRRPPACPEPVEGPALSLSKGRNRAKPCISVHRLVPRHPLCIGQRPPRARNERASLEGHSCAIVTTIAHDEIAIPQNCPKNRAKKSAFPRDCYNSFCALWTTIAHDCKSELRRRFPRMNPESALREMERPKVVRQ